LQHRERTALERHQVEEPATVLERDPMLHFDQPGGSGPILEHALFDLHRPVRWADQQTRRFGHRVPQAFNHGAKVALVVFEG